MEVNEFKYVNTPEALQKKLNELLDEQEQHDKYVQKRLLLNLFWFLLCAHLPFLLFIYFSYSIKEFWLLGGSSMFVMLIFSIVLFFDLHHLIRWEAPNFRTHWQMKIAKFSMFVIEKYKALYDR